MYILKTFLLKWVMITAILAVVYSLFYSFSFAQIITLSVVFTVIAYIGDLIIVPRINNMLATSTDFILAFFGLALLSRLFFETNSTLWLPAFIAALFIGVGEFFFHRYLLEQMETKAAR